MERMRRLGHDSYGLWGREEQMPLCTLVIHPVQELLRCAAPVVCCLLSLGIRLDRIGLTNIHERPGLIIVN